MIDQLAIKAINPDPLNPRKEFDDAELRSLSESLRDHGLIEPIVVRRMGHRRFRVIAGERRLRAAVLAGWTHISAVVRDVTDAKALELQLIENLQRRDLNPMEKAIGVDQLCRPLADGGAGKSAADVAAMFGKGKDWVLLLLRLLKLPPVWQERIVRGELLESHARYIAPHSEDPKTLAKIEADMVANPWGYATKEQVQRSVKLIVDGSPAIAQGRSAAQTRPTVHPPMQRQDRPAVIAIGVAGESDVVETADPGDQASTVESIVAAIAGVASIEEIDRIEAAAATQRAVIAGEREANDVAGAIGDSKRVKRFAKVACG